MEKMKKEMELRNRELINIALSRISAYDGGSAILGHVFFNDDGGVQAYAHVVESAEYLGDVKLRTYLFTASCPEIILFSFYDPLEKDFVSITIPDFFEA